mmetsp:Transcript_25666/g.41353  ORF Transcript_25666/g.41353 Transcript_25666/m.41353 type:complete len:160 (+) Transcript_25666:470-949(+)
MFIMSLMFIKFLVLCFVCELRSAKWETHSRTQGQNRPLNRTVKHNFHSLVDSVCTIQGSSATRTFLAENFGKVLVWDTSATKCVPSARRREARVGLLLRKVKHIARIISDPPSSQNSEIKLQFRQPPGPSRTGHKLDSRAKTKPGYGPGHKARAQRAYY